MTMNNVLRSDEAAVFALRTLFSKYGYSGFKMNKFEEYDLYVSNKDFLVSEGVITFMDNDGKLLALKPDVTLSIVKNFTYNKGIVRKVYYDENVYRMSKSTKSFTEILQTGLECLGDIDNLNVAEVIMLAAKSLEQINEVYALDISHLGIISALTESAGLKADIKAELIKCIGEKNVGGICALELGEELTEAFTLIASAYGKKDEVIASLRSLKLAKVIEEPIKELEELFDLLDLYDVSDNIKLDFSIVNDMSYYNGIVFAGYIPGIAAGVLSGGRYDNLLAKMGKKGGAVGFAVYLDMLQWLNKDKKQYDVDSFILYDDATDKAMLINKVNEKALAGSVLYEKALTADIKYREFIDLRGGKTV